MDLDAQIDLRPHRLAQPPHIVDRLVDLRRVRFVIRFVLALIQQRIEVSQRGEPGFLQPHRLFHQLLDRASLHMSIQPGLVPHLAAQQLVDRHIEELALDIPQRDVDRRHCPGDRPAGEMIGPQHHVPMMLDRERILADKVVAIFRDRGGRRLELAPGARFTDAGNAPVRADPHIKEAIQQQRFDLGDLHGGPPRDRQLQRYPTERSTCRACHARTAVKAA